MSGWGVDVETGKVWNVADDVEDDAAPSPTLANAQVDQYVDDV